MQACSRVVCAVSPAPPPEEGRFLKAMSKKKKNDQRWTGNAHRERKLGWEQWGCEREREEMKSRGEKSFSFFVLGAQKSILNSKVYQSKLSLEFTASLIFTSETISSLPSTPAFTFPPVKTVE